MKATIAEVGARGHLDVTVAQIARRAGMSAALAHHYFGGKEQIFLAAMRHVLTLYRAEVVAELAVARGPRARLDAVVRANFAPSSFRRDTIRAWLNFYVLAESNPQARRLVGIYHRRLESNLLHDLRRIAPARAADIARGLGALIDGAYLREALSPAAPDGAGAARLVLSYLARELGEGPG